MRTCSAITFSGERCQRAARANGRCHWHGGQSVDGKWGKVVPKHLRARYRNSSTDPNLVSVRDEIALTDARIEELLTCLASGGSPTAWRTLNEAVQRYREAVDAGESDPQHHLLSQLEATIAEAGHNAAVWANIHALVEQRRRLIECEQKTLIFLKNYMPFESAVEFADSLTDAVIHHVPDPAVRQAIADELKRLELEADAKETSAP